MQIRYSSSTLLEYADALPMKRGERGDDVLTLLEFAAALLEVYRRNEKQDRVTVPAFEFTDLLLEAGTLQKLCGEEVEDVFSFKELLDRVRKESARSRDIRKLVATAKVLCGLISIGGIVRERALQALLGYLVHPYPRVRRQTADQLYLTLVASSIEETDEMAEVEEVLTCTSWMDPVPQIKHTRDRLYTLLNVPKPVLRSETGNLLDQNSIPESRSTRSQV